MNDVCECVQIRVGYFSAMVLEVGFDGYFPEPTEKTASWGDNDKRKSVAIGIFFPAPNQSQKFYNCADISSDKV